MYIACIGSVKCVLFSDKFTMSVTNNLNLLESDHESESLQSMVSGSTRRSNSHLSLDLHIKGSSSEGEEDNNARSHHSSRHDWREEQGSPPRSQAGASDIAQGGPQGPPVPRD